MTLPSRIAAVALGASACVHPGPTPERETADAGQVRSLAQPVAELVDVANARGAAHRFVSAAEKKDFESAYGQLSGALRARYTPQRLASDFSAEPLAVERLARVKAALAAPLRVIGNSAELPLGDGRAFRLVKEDGEWKVAALE